MPHFGSTLCLAKPRTAWTERRPRPDQKRQLYKRTKGVVLRGTSSKLALFGNSHPLHALPIAPWAGNLVRCAAGQQPAALKRFSSFRRQVQSLLGCPNAPKMEINRTNLPQFCAGHINVCTANWGRFCISPAQYFEFCTRNVDSRKCAQTSNADAATTCDARGTRRRWQNLVEPEIYAHFAPGAQNPRAKPPPHSPSVRRPPARAKPAHPPRSAQ